MPVDIDPEALAEAIETLKDNIPQETIDQLVGSTVRIAMQQEWPTVLSSGLIYGAGYEAGRRMIGRLADRLRFGN